MSLRQKVYSFVFDIIFLVLLIISYLYCTRSISQKMMLGNSFCGYYECFHMGTLFSSVFEKLMIQLDYCLVGLYWASIGGGYDDKLS